MRLTNLSLEKIVEFLRLDNHLYGRSVLVNEICQIAMETRDKNAEKKLAELLTEKDENVRYVAYCCLCTLQEKDTATLEAMEAFIAQPENAELVKEAARHRIFHVIR
jgi:hypothetical protein